jgi:lysophospholipase L1-like esterase
MHWLTYHLASGEALFSGCALLLIAAAMLTFGGRTAVRAGGYGFWVLGVALVLLCGVPTSGWTWTVARMAIVTGLFLPLLTRLARPTIAKGAIAILVAAMLVQPALREMRYRASPTFEQKVPRVLYVIGDSVSAGIGRENGNTWPRLIARDRGVRGVDLSRGGATMPSALNSIRNQRFGSGLVLLEIGGNDMFGHVSTKQFEEDLRALIKRVAGSDRTVVLMELPVLVFRADLVDVQRHVARDEGVKLIPRHHFANMLAREGATFDRIHLTEPGQRRAAEIIWTQIRDAFLDE